MAYLPIEETDVYEHLCTIADEIWDVVPTWDAFAKDTVGKQLVKAIDSVSANMSEGDARGTDPDAIRFFKYARGSAREARNWLRRAQARKLIDALLAQDLVLRIESATKGLNGIIRFRQQSRGIVKESKAPEPDPFDSFADE